MDDKDFELILKTGDAEKSKKKIRDKLIGLMKNTPEITTGELAEMPGITVKGIEWNLNTRKEKGIIKRVGPAKGVHWEVIE